MVYNTIEYSEQTLNEILSVAGYPAIPKEALFEELPETDLKQLIILPAMREFHKWFPQVLRQEYDISSTFEIDFPNSNVFNVHEVRLNTAAKSGQPSASPFLNLVNYTQSSYRTYGTPYDYGFREARVYQEQDRRAVIDRYKGVNFDVDTKTRKLTGYTTMNGTLIVSWSVWDSQLENVPFNRLQEVIDLCKVNLLEYLGNLRGQQNSSLENTFNFQLMLDKAKDMKEEIMTKWKAFSKVVVIRG